MSRQHRATVNWMGVDVHPTARTEVGSTIEEGTVRTTFVLAHAWVMTDALVGHDAYVGYEALICTKALLGGHVIVGERAKVGIGAVILPHRRIGAGAEIGAGAVVTRDVPAGEIWAGNPARPLPGRNPVPFSERGGYEAQLEAELDRIAVPCSGFGQEGPPCATCPNDERCPAMRRRIRLNMLDERKGKQVIVR